MKSLLLLISTINLSYQCPVISPMSGFNTTEYIRAMVYSATTNNWISA